MKRSEIHDAAKAFVTNHTTYITTWASQWDRSMASFSALIITTTNGVPHPDWEKLTPEEIVNLFNDFWQSLPDSPSIRGYGFGALCDIAEHVFGFDDEEELEPTEA